MIQARSYLSAWIEAPAGTVTELKVATGGEVCNGQGPATVTATEITTTRIWAIHLGQVRTIVAGEGEKTNGVHPLVPLKFGST